jgi:hypothetical protein
MAFTKELCITANKMSDGGRERALLGAKELKSSQKWSVQRSAVRSIAWLDEVAWLTDLASHAQSGNDCEGDDNQPNHKKQRSAS